MGVFHTSDLHIGHRSVAEQRWYALHPSMAAPEDYVGWHDRMLAENWDATVTEHDTVWVQGDLCIGGNRANNHALAWMSERPGTKKYIMGNHGGEHPGVERSEARKWFLRYMEVFDVVWPFARIRINGTVVLLSHFPYQGGGDHTVEERYSQWRLPDLGEWLLHGHTHSTEKLRPGTKMIHIGVDSWDFTPVHQDEIIKIMEEHG